jgi:6-pyruvoyltetrahydropterin/6-carboxytetrahydropterin synthase
MINLTKQYKFCAAHRYWNESWSEEKNNEVFGDDVRIHGHNYILSITLKGEINEESGFIVDLQKLNKIVNEKVINVFDHSQIEKDIEWFEGKQPSTENMVVYIWKQLVNIIPSDAQLYCVKLRETPTIFSEYYGS